MQTFFCKLNPPRPTFAQDMSEAEGKLMQEHAAYWGRGIQEGRVVTFGLVGDPAGAYGIGIIEVESPSEAQAFTAKDPVILAGRGFRYELFSMPMGAAHARAGAQRA